jgi:hypothetical protein
VEGEWHVKFDNNGESVLYELSAISGEIHSETLIRDNTKVLTRGKDGIGKIWFEKQQDFVDFQCPVNQLAAFARRDSLQHPFFEPLHNWGSSLRHYQFGSQMGHHLFAVKNALGENEREDDWDDAATQRVLNVFRKGKAIGPDYVEAVIRDMRSLDYNIDTVFEAAESDIVTNVGAVYSLTVKEHDLLGNTSQFGMSQGMWRALALIIQVNYQVRSNESCAILIDDIGEGLDYARAKSMIGLLIERAKTGKFQLIMTTNDRFIMNEVPLDYWSVAERTGKDVRLFNSSNSKESFENFKYAGLSNFEFFKNANFTGN